MKNDAFDGDWIKYPTAEHPRLASKITSATLIVKLNSKNDVREEGLFHPAEIQWITNPDGTLHTHRDPSWVSCYYALTLTEYLNKEILSETVPMDPETCR